ncbi:hypothetical protein P2318_32980 [Myxococcaceae bacterium GXIMD 01537]
MLRNEVLAEHLLQMLEEALPATASESRALEVVEVTERAGNLFALLRHVTWAVDGVSGGKSIRDVTEQDVYFLPEACRDSRARVAAFVLAWARVVQEVQAHWDAEPPEGAIYPETLVCISPLELARAVTEADFETALRHKKRLGKFLQAQAAPSPTAGSGADAVSGEELLETLRAALPASDALKVSLEADGASDMRGDLVVRFHRILWLIDEETGARSPHFQSMMDSYRMTEEVLFVRGAQRGNRERVEAYVRAWARVLKDVLSAPDAEHLAPSLLVCAEVLELPRAASEEDFERVLRGPAWLGKYLPEPEASVPGMEEPGAVSAEALSELLRAALSESEAPGASLEPGSVEEDRGWLVGVFRLVIRNENELDASGRPLIWDVKEQELRLVRLGRGDRRERVEAYVRAWARVLRDLLRLPVVEELLPEDLFRGEVLELADLESEEDFEQMLRNRKWLGKLLKARAA